MTREVAKALEANPVWRAWRDEGKTMQLNVDGEWRDDKYPDAWYFANYPHRYRIKPEPRTWWELRYSDGTSMEYPSREMALDRAKTSPYKPLLVELRMIIY